MNILNIFTWYWNLFSDDDNKVRIGAWAATITTLTFLLTFIIKPFRVYLINKIRLAKTSTLETFSKLIIKYTSEDLKRNLKIIVVDDDDIFPVNGFNEFGYKIDRWEKLDERKFKRLKDGEFDIIILDIIGIAKDISENDGLGVLKDIKAYNPSQVIVAYSGQSFDIMKNSFWELADEKLGKPTPFIGTQEIIDNLIERTFTVQYHQDKIEKILAEGNVLHESEKIQNLFMTFKKTNSEPIWQDQLQNIPLRNGEKIKIASILSKLFRLTVIG